MLKGLWNQTKADLRRALDAGKVSGSSNSAPPPPKAPSQPAHDPVVNLAARVYLAQSLGPIITLALVLAAAYWFFTRP